MANRSKTLSKIARFRLRFTFWLDLNKPDENAIAELIATLKEKNLFVKTVRDGIRLICDLRAGQLDTLFELFPWVQEALIKQTTDMHVSSGVGQLDEIKSILELVVRQQTAGGYMMQSSPSAIQKPLPAPPVAEAKAATQVSADDIASNFLSMFN